MIMALHVYFSVCGCRLYGFLIKFMWLRVPLVILHNRDSAFCSNMFPCLSLLSFRFKADNRDMREQFPFSLFLRWLYFCFCHKPSLPFIFPINDIIPCCIEAFFGKLSRIPQVRCTSMEYAFLMSPDICDFESLHAYAVPRLTLINPVLEIEKVAYRVVEHISSSASRPSEALT